MSNLYPPSEKRLADLRRRDIFPRSSILESTAALIGASLVVIFFWAAAINELKLLASLSFDLSKNSAAIDISLFVRCIGYVMMVLLGAAAARLIVIKCESRMFIRWPEIDMARIFAISDNLSGFFGRLGRGLLLSSVMLTLYLFVIVGILPSMPGLAIDGQLWKPGHLIIGVGVVLLFGAVEIFRSVVVFGSNYGMTREELISEQQELRPELRAEIQNRIRDGE